MTAPKPPAQKKRGPPPRVTGKLQRALEALMAGEAKTQIEAAEIAGISKEHLCRALKLPHVEEWIVKRSRNQNATVLLARANAVILDILDHSDNASVKADLAKHVRGSNGIGAVSPGSGGSIGGAGIVLNIVLGGQADGQQAPSIRAKSVQAVDLEAENVDGSDG